MKKSFLVIFLFFFIYCGTNEYIVSIDNKKVVNITASLAKKTTHNKKTIQANPFIEFCEKYREIGNLYEKEYGIPTSIQLAQAICESGGGKSELAIVSNNLFGMKYYKEIFNGEYIETKFGTRWRKYNSFEDSFKDHAIFLNKYYPSAVGKDWKFWVKNCKGYGGVQYWKHIGDIIEIYDLGKYDISPSLVINY